MCRRASGWRLRTKIFTSTPPFTIPTTPDRRGSVKGGHSQQRLKFAVNKAGGRTSPHYYTTTFPASQPASQPSCQCVSRHMTHAPSGTASCVVATTKIFNLRIIARGNEESK
ncbi:hypothetical protein E2C01_036873 [Portunus trituberculatus]|uniref:Uncharacterized protein n=1 Tax=Portunus trituberculatus TaxID=210409 RepID=A0A5B7FDM9_PORTR|nr:hypothetical protein [Portunus trituberculatus]